MDEAEQRAASMVMRLYFTDGCDLPWQVADQAGWIDGAYSTRADAEKAWREANGVVDGSDREIQVEVF